MEDVDAMSNRSGQYSSEAVFDSDHNTKTVPRVPVDRPPPPLGTQASGPREKLNVSMTRFKDMCRYRMIAIQTGKYLHTSFLPQLR